jgi:hypothetical protein
VGEVTVQDQSLRAAYLLNLSEPKYGIVPVYRKIASGPAVTRDEIPTPNRFGRPDRAGGKEKEAAEER